MEKRKENIREMTGKELAEWMDAQKREFILHVEWEESDYEPESI